MTPALADINEADRCEPCGGKIPLSQLCSNMQNTSTFKSSHLNKVCHMKKTFTVILKWWFREQFGVRAQTLKFSKRAKSAKPSA